MSKPLVAIVADDFTGAGDAAIAFAEKGLQTQVRLWDRLGSLETDADVLSVSTNTRSAPAAAAYQTVFAAVSTLRQQETAFLYKKMDSTLRGAVAAEIEATLDAWHPDSIAIVCPAFPEMGRTVEQGILYVYGQKVAQTAFGQDSFTPVTESHLPSLLDAPLLTLTQDPERRVAQMVDDIRAQNSRIVVLDAADRTDMHDIASVIQRLGALAVPVGSAGLAQSLVPVWPLPALQSAVLVLVTSQNAVTLEQVEHLQLHGAQVFSPTEVVIADNNQWQMWQEQCLGLFESKRPAIVVLRSPTTLGLDSDWVATRMGDLAAALLNHFPFAGAIATGGDGATALMQSLHATRFHLLNAVTEGVPFGTISNGQIPGLPLITKAGGFGTPQTLLRAVEALQKRRV